MPNMEKSKGRGVLVLCSDGAEERELKNIILFHLQIQIFIISQNSNTLQ